MAEKPMPYQVEADTPVVPIEGVTDQRVIDTAQGGAGLKFVIRDRFSDGPNVELACRYVDLAVQAAHAAAQDSPPEPPGEPVGQP